MQLKPVGRAKTGSTSSLSFPVSPVFLFKVP